MQLLSRFLIGGAFVSVFAVIGDSLNPKSFAGLFGAAPSIALAGLMLTWATHGSNVVVVQARSMIFGSIALLVYGTLTAKSVRQSKLPTWVVAVSLWAVWLAVAFFFHWILLK